MSYQIDKNLASSTLASGYTAGNTTLTLQTGDGSKFSASGNFVVALGTAPDFFLLCTSRSGDTLTVGSSGVEGTAAVNESSGCVVTQVITSATLVALLAAAGGPPSGAAIHAGQTFSSPINTGQQNYSFLTCIPGSILQGYPATWKVSMMFLGGSPVIGGIVVKRTLPYSLSVVDTTTITIGGSSTPTLTTPGYVLTDAVSLQLDATHDYWIVIFFANVGANGSVVIPYGGTILRGGYASGDSTGVSTISYTGSTGSVIAIVMP